MWVLTKEAQLAYTQRNATILKMGYASYQDYLDSPLWASIRKRVFARSKRCVGCKKRANQVHHGNYGKRILKGKDLSQLFPVCDDCHEEAEFNEQGEKLGPSQATKRLHAMHGSGEVRKEPVPMSHSFVRAVESMRLYVGGDVTDEARTLADLLDTLWPHGTWPW